MFTGIIQATGKISLNGLNLAVSVKAPGWDDWQIGESVAVNGCCLTVVSATAINEGGFELRFDLSEETLRRTNLGGLKPDSRVNLERAMRPSDRFGGHIVQGHVDDVGEVVSLTPTDGAVVFRFRVPADRYLIDKGSIALDGVSLTVVEPKAGEFDVWVIPHTLQETSLGDLSPGSKVNVEYDVIAKHVERLLRP